MEIGRSPITNILKELWTESKSERNNGISKWVAAASLDDPKLALLMAKDLLENLKEMEDVATPLASMDVNFSWGTIKKYLAMLLALITMPGKRGTSEVLQKSNKGDSEAPSRSSAWPGRLIWANSTTNWARVGCRALWARSRCLRRKAWTRWSGLARWPITSSPPCLLCRQSSSRTRQALSSVRVQRPS